MNNSRFLVAASLPALALAAAAPALAGEVTGSVIDASDTIALRAAEVRIVELARVAATGDDGRFFFNDIPAGEYTLEARYVGVDPVRRAIAVPQTGGVRVDVAMGRERAQHILVLGQAANQAGALSRKRASDTISDVLTRDAIGQFPDQNVAESLRRLPGVNILNDQGEGRFVSVRGLDPNLNATSVNGVRLPSPEADVRSVALDVISSDIIESIEVKKSLTPDMDADTIGASIEIETTSAFNRRRDLLTATIEGSYNDFASETSPKASLDFSTRATDNFGISGGVSYYNRTFETDNIEADGWSNAGTGNFATDVEYRDYDVERERISATLGLDFRAGDTTELYVKGIYSRFDDQEYRRRLVFDFGDFEDDGPSAGGAAGATFSDADQEFTVDRDIKDRFERQTIGSVVAGGETRFDGWHFTYSGSYARSTEKERGSIDPAKFTRDFSEDGLSVLFDYSDRRVPLYSVTGNIYPFIDATGYELDDIEVTALSDARDEEYAAKFDAGHDFQTGGGTLTVQAGFKGRWRQKTYNKTTELFEYDGLTLADVQGPQTYRITDIQPVPSHGGTRDFFDANRDGFELVEGESAFESAVGDFRVKEDVLAGYLLGRFETGTLRVIGGVRYENTSNRISGNSVTLVEEGGALPNGSAAEDDTVFISPTSFKRDYDHWLPSLNIRYAPQPNVVLRAAGYRSLVRPQLQWLAPRFTIEESDDGDREGSFGNPDLKPYEAWNADVSAEYYFSGNGAISVAGFYKDIKNYIVETTREDGVFNGIAYTEANIPINGPSAEVWGVELSVSQALTMLPSPFDGLLVQANYTYTDAKGLLPTDGDVADLRKITLPATSKHTANIVLGYEKGPFSFRLAGTYRDRYLDEAGAVADEDRYVDDHFQLDLSARYRVNKLVQLYYEWVNINDAKYFAYNNFGGQRNLYQYERYNWTMKFGARLTF